MKPRPPLPPGPFLVVGLGRSGMAAALALRARGEEVIGCDAGEPDAGRLREAGVEVHLNASGIDLLRRSRTIVKSPGVPSEAPLVAAARQQGTPVLGELELAWRLIPNEFIAVTGTNGKTTTSELIGEIHREAGVPAVVAGNVGVALASLVDDVAKEAVVVCEASSFQLEDTLELAPEAGVLVSLGDDHLDRHGSRERYHEAKLQVFARQGNDDVAVAPHELAQTDLGGCARRVWFGAGPGPEVSERAGQLWWVDQPLIPTGEIRMLGAHNRQNAMAAAAVALARGIDPDAVRAALRGFPGVPHRLEEVGSRGGVAYVNDSKATNVGSTQVALRSFEPGRVHVILGGRAKGQRFEALREDVERACRAVYLVGEAAPEIARALERVPLDVESCGDLPRAVAHARARAVDGEVVLLSPACASYDQYGDFEERGEHFRALALEEGP
jgi:UDP-N-acetylmuramoylalanine--D-glutamate ligase